MARKRSKRGDDALLNTLACGASNASAAKAAGISERTLYRRLQDPNFLKRLQEIRNDMTRRTTDLFNATALEAGKTLYSLMQSGNPATVRLGAAKAVVKLGNELRELADLGERLSELETVIKQDVG